MSITKTTPSGSIVVSPRHCPVRLYDRRRKDIRCGGVRPWREYSRCFLIFQDQTPFKPSIPPYPPGSSRMSIFHERPPYPYYAFIIHFINSGAMQAVRLTLELRRGKRASVFPSNLQRLVMFWHSLWPV